MRITLKSITAVVLALMLISMSAYAGGGNRVGTAGAEQVLTPVGARGIALSSSYSAGISGLNAIFYNPAGLSAGVQRAEAIFSYMSNIGDIGTSYFAVGSKFSGFGDLAFSVKTLSFGDIITTDEKNPDGTGAVYTPAFVTVGLTYSRSLTDRIRAGFTGYLISESMNRVSGSTFAMDVGIQYSGLGGVKGLMMGVTLRHLGAQMTYDGSALYRPAKEVGTVRDAQLLKIVAAGANLPTSLELGLAYSLTPAPDHALTIMGSFENNNYLDDQYRIGVEYCFQNLFFLRGSYVMAPEALSDSFDNSKSNFLYGPAFGAGVYYHAGDLALSVDYAYRSSQIFSGQHVMTLGIGF
jgi:hypothetical protein